MAQQLPEHPKFLKFDRKGPVLGVWLNSPETRNALVQGMAEELLQTFDALRADRGIRIVVLRGAGETFCAGGDLKSFQAAGQPPQAGKPDTLVESNRRGGALFRLIDEARQALIVVVEGFAFGGGFGLACLGDVTIVRADAQFAMTETTLGLVPAQISPYVVRRVGLTTARRFAVSGARFDGLRAQKLGLAHEVADTSAALEALVDKTITQILKCAPDAVAATKALMQRVAQGQLGPEEIIAQAAQDFAAAARGSEGAEGLRAFVEKRSPTWLHPWPAKEN